MANRECRNVSMAVFARALPAISPRYIDAPVVDQKGLNGHYDFKLTWRPQQLDAKGGDAPTGPAIFQAVRQLGLKLESRRLPIPVIVVERSNGLRRTTESRLGGG
jgi:uncharacterized protein (TIGR03435 family)